MYTKVKTPAEIDAMRESGRMLASVLDKLQPLVEPGISTQALAAAAEKELKALGGEAPFKGYQGFPSVICISVNEEVVHGIPKDDKILTEGDILSLDFGVRYRGMITDSALSMFVGVPRSDREKNLVQATQQSLQAGISVVCDGVKIGDIASAVQAVLDRAKFGIVRDLVGHGVGHELHEDPNIPNYGRAGNGAALQAGMTIAIEPMATIGDWSVYVDTDEWTVVTRDGSRSAHFEHTVLITDDGYEVLTARSDESF